jgi:hypothetical protein
MKPYPPAWLIIPQTYVRAERWPGGYRATASPLVSFGQDVLPDQPVLCWQRWQSAGRLADGHSSPLAGAWHPQTSAVSGPIQKGSPEFISAGLRGLVVEITARGGVVIESQAIVVQGVIGAGDQVAGILVLWQLDTLSLRQPIPPGAILVVPGPLNFMLLRQAVSSGVVGIISGSISLRDLEGFLHVDFISFVQESRSELRQILQQHFPPLTILLTNGFGNVPMSADLLAVLSQYQGSIALLSGETSLCQGLVPELIISSPYNSFSSLPCPSQPDALLTPGARVRICSGDYGGQVGTLEYLFVYGQRLPSGLYTRAALIHLDGGLCVTVPLLSLVRVG